MSTQPVPGAVVVGVDGSTESDEAVRWGAVYAQLQGKPMMLVNGAGTPILIPTELIEPAEVRRQMRVASRRVTDRALSVAHMVAPGLDVTVSNPPVDARQALLDCADTAGMVVVGTRGRGPVRSLLLGSVSVAVVTHASCPVTVVRSGGAGAGPRPIVIGVDDIGSSALAMDFGFDLASETGRQVVVLHAWDTPEEELTLHARTVRHEWHERALAEAIAGYAEKYPDVAIDRRLLEGKAAPLLVEAASAADHLVVGSRGRHGIRSWLGSVSRAVVEHAGCPVTVIPTGRPMSREVV